MIAHLDDKNLPPACTSSFSSISEQFLDIRYNMARSGVFADDRFTPWQFYFRQAPRRLFRGII
jgi:hypothetical protein